MKYNAREEEVMIVPKSNFIRLPLMALAAGAVLALAGPPTSALAAGCATVAEPAGLQTEFPHQIELLDFIKQTGETPTFSESPGFAAQVAAGKLPAVEQRLPEEPLVVLPYVDCGKYGGTLRGIARAYESGTSEILSWRQLNMVRYSDDMETVVPNVAKRWKWNDDYTEVTFYLRKGHKWSDGKPFTADDVTFWANDIPLVDRHAGRENRRDHGQADLRQALSCFVAVHERNRFLLHALRQHAIPVAHAHQIQSRRR
jgi:ABC-type transport system substrate-binding protein